jgi:hypothetical protein
MNPLSPGDGVMNNRLIWLFPYVNGIVIGVILLATNGFDVSSVIGAWMFIGLVLVAYTCVLRALPVSDHTCQDTHQVRKSSAPPTMTATQVHYLNAIAKLRNDQGALHA